MEASDRDTEEVERLERSFGEAITRNDSGALERLLADDSVGTNPLARVLDKRQTMAELASPDYALEWLVNEDIRVRLLGDVALATARGAAKGSYRGQDASGQFRYTRVWVKRRGQWRAVAAQATMIPADRSPLERSPMVVNRSAPTATVVPILVYEDVVTTIEWLCDAFGFSERLRAGGPGGVTHAQLTVGDGAVMLGRQGGEFRLPRPHEVNQYVVVHVDDVDRHYDRARQRGARILKPPTDMPFGERQYTAEDPGGHRWTFSQSIADVAPEQWGARPPEPR